MSPIPLQKLQGPRRKPMRRPPHKRKILLDNTPPSQCQGHQTIRQITFLDQPGQATGNAREDNGEEVLSPMPQKIPHL